jgi:hypothetical protein
MVSKKLQNQTLEMSEIMKFSNDASAAAMRPKLDGSGKARDSGC